MPKQYRVAVIGHTSRGDYGHAVDTAWLSVSRTDIVAVADANKGGMAAAMRRLKVDRAYLDYRKMIDETRPDIVAIGPRWVDQHRDMAIYALERGSHVYMEKPFCRTLIEADEIVAACEKSNTKLAVAHPTRYSPKLNTIKALIASGKIGKVLEYRGRGKEDSRGGGLDLWVLGSHVMDMIHAIGGRPKWCYAKVKAGGKPITKQNVVDGAEGIGPLAGDHVQAMYGMPDRSTAYFGSKKNAAGRPSRYGLQIFGSKGIIELLEGVIPSVKYLPDAAWSPGRSGAKWQNVSSAGIGKPEPLTGEKYKARHTLAILDLLKSIEKDRQPLCGVYTVRETTEMIAAVFESHRLNKPVKLPLENRENPLTLLS
jgi:predicted dehydrogenase